MKSKYTLKVIGFLLFYQGFVIATLSSETWQYNQLERIRSEYDNFIAMRSSFPFQVRYKEHFMRENEEISFFRKVPTRIDVESGIPKPFLPSRREANTIFYLRISVLSKDEVCWISLHTGADFKELCACIKQEFSAIDSGGLFFEWYIDCDDESICV